MGVLSSFSRRLKRQRLTRLVFIASVLTVIITTWSIYGTPPDSHVQLQGTKPGLLDDSVSFSATPGGGNKGNDDTYRINDIDSVSYYRTASKISPFSDVIAQIRNQIKAQSHKLFLFKMFEKVSSDKIISNWNASNKTEQCKYLLKGFYKVPNWSNNAILKEYENDALGQLVFTLTVERLRIYDYCFLHGDEDLQEIFSDRRFKHATAQDFNTRMFPFMHFPSEKLLWPTIYDMSKSDGIIENTILLKPEVDNIENFNLNFWQNWAKYSKGQGLILTMQESDSVMFYRQLKVLKALKNTLPIQVITTGKEVTPQFLEELSTYSKQLNQQVYLVDLSPILDKQFADTYIQNFFNKWIAQLFNTFEEALFIDVDAVPYVPIKSFFEIDSYKKTGILMYRDRSLVDENTFRRCINLVHELEPSKEEISMTKRRLLFDNNWITEHKHIEDVKLPSTEARIYRNFFEKLHLHHVDSGLIVINKKLKLNGLLMSFYTNLDSRLRTCVYGDKEIVWLGELIAGEDYSIDPMEGGILGPLNREEHGEKLHFSICGSQIGHIDSNNKLMWSNGGLRTCKFYNTAAADFESDEEYFTSRYKSSSNLQRIYDSPLVIDGVIIPDPDNDPWIQIKECSNYMYCAFATRSESKHVGNLIEFDQVDRNIYKGLSETWNSNDIPELSLVSQENNSKKSKELANHLMSM